MTKHKNRITYNITAANSQPVIFMMEETNKFILSLIAVVFVGHVLMMAIGSCRIEGLLRVLSIHHIWGKVYLHPFLTFFLLFPSSFFSQK